MNSFRISQVLQNCYSRLVEDRIYSPRLVDHLYSRNCINTEEIEQIKKCGTTDFDKSRKLLDVLRTKPDTALDILLEYLHEDGTQPQLERLILESAEHVSHELEGNVDTGPTVAKRTKISPLLPQKWWPEHKELITSFVDRSASDGVLLVEHIRTQLTTNELKVAAIVSKKHAIVGMGGIGKTSTAKWYANHFQHMYDHIIWLDSEGPSLAKSFSELGKKLGISPDESLPGFVKEILDHLAGARCLFVFDNAERFEGDNGLRSLLPRHENHHTIITSRNHDWGNPNEFGRIATFELSVFTEDECISLLTNTLASVTKLPSRDTMVALGVELGFLPLALQCAVATIVKSRRYTVDSYLERIRSDLKILVDKKILSEYERTVSATLHLSLEQIERDEEIELECREWCKIIVNVAAYCEPAGIPESLFLGLPDVSKNMLEDAVDQLLLYSIVSFETYEDRFGSQWRVFGIHRLLQHVIRHKVLVDSERAIRAIKLAFQCMQVDFDAFERHALCAWNLASEQFEEILLSCHDVPFQISLSTYDTDVEFIRKALQSLKKGFQDWDVPIMQLQLRLVEALSFHEEWSEARTLLDSLIRLLSDTKDVHIPYKVELLLHLEIVSADLTRAALAEESEDDTGSEGNEMAEAQEFVALAGSYEKLLQQVYDSGYNGKLGDTLMYYSTTGRCKDLSFRSAVALNYVACLCDAGQADKAIEAMKTQLFTIGEEIANGIHGVEQFLSDGYANVLQAILPELYTLLRPSIITATATESFSEEECLRIEAIGTISLHYIWWLRLRDTSNQSNRSDEYLEVLGNICKMRWPASCAITILDGVVSIFQNVVESTRSSIDQLQIMVNIMQSAWENLESAIKVPVTNAPTCGTRTDCTVKLIQMNGLLSFAMLRTGMMAQVLDLDAKTSRLLDLEGTDWAEFHQVRSDSLEQSRGINIRDMVNTEGINGSEMESILRSKLRLAMQIIHKSVDPSVAHDYRTVASLLAAFDDACLIHAHLREYEQTAALWSQTLEFVNGANAVKYIRISSMFILGLRTLTILEEQEETRATMHSYMVAVSECVLAALREQKGQYCDYELRQVLPLMLRLVTYEQYTTALLLAQRVTQDGGDDFNSLRELVPDLVSLGQATDSQSVETLTNRLKLALNQLVSDSLPWNVLDGESAGDGRSSLRGSLDSDEGMGPT